jgi:hypothetical protein
MYNMRCWLLFEHKKIADELQRVYESGATFRFSK